MLTAIRSYMAQHRDAHAFDLGVILKRRQVAEIIGQGISVYDSALNPIGVVNRQRLCPADSSERDLPCRSCQLGSVDEIAPAGQWVNCAPGVRVFIGPVNVHGRPIGFIVSEQFGASGTSAETGPAMVGAMVDKLQNELPGLRRKRIISRARSAIRKAGNQQAIRTALYDAAFALFCSVRNVYFSTLRGEMIELDHPPEEMPLTTSISRGEGHLGLVLKTRRSHYEPNLRPSDPYFKSDNNRPLPVTVFTVPTMWSADDLPGTVQIQATVENACPDPSERRAYERLAAWAGAQAVKIAMRAELLKARLRAVESSDWRQQVLDLILDHDHDLTSILKTRHAIIRRFASELLQVGGEHCTGSCVRVYRPVSDEIHYEVCEGDAWTDEARKTLFNMTSPNIGKKALEIDTSIYYPDVSRVPEHSRVLEKAKAVWAKRFMVRGTVQGVASLSWSVTDPCTSELLSVLESLVAQFEAIRDELATHEDAFYRQLETTVLNRDPDEMRTIVRKLADIFDAKHCSLFLDRSGDGEILTLYATTHPEGAQAIRKKQYAFGEGITGWVGKYRTAVIIRNPADSTELAEGAIRHGVREPIRWTGGFGHTPPPGDFGVLASAMVARNKVVGVIRLGGVPQQGDFEHEAEAFLLGIADRLASEFDRIWIEEDANKQLHDLRKMAEAVDFDAAVRAALEGASASAGADGAYIQVLDQQGGLLSIQSSGVLRSLLQDEFTFPICTTPHFSRHIWSDGTWSTVCAGLVQKHGPQVRELLNSGAFAPLLNNDADVGATLGLCFRTLPTWSWHWAEWLEKLAAATSSALRPALRLARVQGELQSQLETLNRLREIGLAYALAKSVSEVAAAVLTSARLETRMELGVLRIYDGKKKVWERIAPDSPEDREKEIFPDALATNNVLQICLEARSSKVIHGLDKDAMWLGDLQGMAPGYRRDQLERVKSWVCIPMRLQNDFLGAIILLSEKEEPFNESVVAPHLDILANYAAAAIHSAITTERQLEIAEPFAMVGSMMGGFLHSIRNELAGARGYWSNLTHMELPEEARERLSRLGESLSAIGGICRDRLSFDPRARIQMDQIDLNALLDETWLDLSRGKNLSDVEVHTRYDPTTPVITGSRIQIETALRMLIQNSIEALASVRNSNTHQVIRLETKLRQGGRHLLLRIADSGPGMSLETKRQAFKPFFTTKDTGNGLGLAVVARVAKAHSAAIKLFSSEGWGTSVSLTFPVQAGK